MAMSRAHFLAYELLEAMVREDVDALDRTYSELNSESDMVHQVLAAITAMLTGSLINVHGAVGALAMLDRARMQTTAMDSITGTPDA